MPRVSAVDRHATLLAAMIAHFREFGARPERVGSPRPRSGEANLGAAPGDDRVRRAHALADGAAAAAGS